MRCIRRWIGSESLLHLLRDTDAERGGHGLFLLRSEVDPVDLLVRVWVFPGHEVDPQLRPAGETEFVLTSPYNLGLRRLLFVFDEEPVAGVFAIHDWNLGFRLILVVHRIGADLSTVLHV